MKKYGKKYVEASKNIDKTKSYSLEDAIKLVKETSITKFDSTIDVAIKLNIDSKKSDQQLKGSLSLPNGTGKTKKVLVIAKGEAAEEAKKAGIVQGQAPEMGNRIHFRSCGVTAGRRCHPGGIREFIRGYYSRPIRYAKMPNPCLTFCRISYIIPANGQRRS